MSGLCKELFSVLLKGALRSKKVVSLWVLATIGGLGNGVTKRVLLAAFTCILAVGMHIFCLTLASNLFSLSQKSKCEIVLGDHNICFGVCLCFILVKVLKRLLVL